jgi:hypothetical protein
VAVAVTVSLSVLVAARALEAVAVSVSARLLDSPRRKDPVTVTLSDSALVTASWSEADAVTVADSVRVKLWVAETVMLSGSLASELPMLLAVSTTVEVPAML